MLHLARSTGRLAGALLALASLGCGADGPAAPPETPALSEFRLHYAGASTGSLRITAASSSAQSLTPPFVALMAGKWDDVSTPNAVVAKVVRAPGREPYDQAGLYLHPSVTRVGRYPAGACPEPGALRGCFALSVELDVVDVGGPAAWLLSSGDEVTLEVEELTPTRLRARFSGRFTYYRRDGSGGGPVTVTDGYVEASRP